MSYYSYNNTHDSYASTSTATHSNLPSHASAHHLSLSNLDTYTDSSYLPFIDSTSHYDPRDYTHIGVNTDFQPNVEQAELQEDLKEEDEEMEYGDGDDSVDYTEGLPQERETRRRGSRRTNRTETLDDRVDLEVVDECESVEEEDSGTPLLVNAKQYQRILKRRIARARLGEIGRLSLEKKVRESLATYYPQVSCTTVFYL